MAATRSLKPGRIVYRAPDNAGYDAMLPGCRLFLAPDQVPGFRVAIDLCFKVLMGEGIQLLDPDNGHVCDLMFSAVSHQVIINLARAGDHAPNIQGFQIFHFRYYRLEAAVGEISETDTDSLCRSRLLGLMSISGLRSGRTICRRRAWNICAGVDGTHTWILYSAHSCR